MISDGGFLKRVVSQKNHTPKPTHHSGVTKQGLYRFTNLTIITVRITIIYRNHYQTKYDSYQQYLFNRIKGYIEHNVSSFGWKQIGDILNSEGYKTPTGKVFKSNHIHSIYKKGKIREERLTSQRKVTKRMETTEYKFEDIIFL